MEYTLCKADTPALYGELRGLWCRVFGDPPEFADKIYETFGNDIAGYIMADEEGKAAASVTVFRCGTYELPLFEDEEGREIVSETLPAYVSYAVCTAPEHRGRGLASGLTSYVRDLVLEAGGVSIVSPASEELADFYDALGYLPCFTAAEQIAFADMADGFDEDWEEDEDDFDGYEPFEPEFTAVPAGAGLYNRYREAFLAEKPHIALSQEMMEVVKSESAEGNGLLIINGGDAICALADDGQTSGAASAYELLVNPMLVEFSLEIEEVIAGGLARYLGVEYLTYRSDGFARLQSMIAVPEGAVYREGSYFGFPLD